MTDFLDISDVDAIKEYTNVKCVNKSDESSDENQTEDSQCAKNKKNTGFFISRIKKKINLDGVLMVAEKKKRIIDNMPWVEKYRPLNLKGILGQYKIQKIFQDCVRDPSKTIPHMVLFGPPGTGKTSIVLAAAKELFGPVLYKKRVIEFNASDDRGIGVVRDKIKKYAESIVGKIDPKYPCPPYKIIILDEADALTSDAQSALRIIIEKYSMHTRFILICNYVHQITTQILSRCTRFRFNSIDDNSIKQRLEYISKKEGLFDKLHKDTINTIISACGGDMRKSITLLQNCIMISELKGIVTKKHILDFLGIIEEKKMLKYLDECKDSKHCVYVAKEIIKSGYPVLIVLNIFVNIIVDHKKLNDTQKSSFILKMSKAEKKLIEGGSEYLQLLSCLIEYMKQIEKRI
jgi:replication factor C subunit 2/4